MATPHETYHEALHWIRSNHARTHAHFNVAQARLIRELTGVYLLLALLLFLALLLR